MMISLVTLAITLARLNLAADEPASCPELSRAGAIAHRMSELPAEVRDDLAAVTHGQIRDVDVPLLNTDAPGAAEAGHAAMRFFQAARFDQFWLVQYQVAMVSGVSTVTYVRRDQGQGEGGAYVRTNRHYFAGPACASIRAALDGVTSYTGFAPAS